MMTFEELRAKLSTDLFALDREIADIPVILQEAAELAAEAANEERRYELELKMILAQTSYNLRTTLTNGKPPSEERIKSEVWLVSEVVAAMKRYNEAQFLAEKAKSIMFNLKEKAKGMQVNAQLLTAGFLTPSYVLKNHIHQGEADKEKLTRRS